LPEKRSQYLVVLIVLVCGVILRFWEAGNLPLTYDEYSSLFRVMKDSFREVLDHGIRTDAHPALHHSFLFIYHKIAGISPLVLKLPYLIFGVLSVWLTFLCGKRYFGFNSGIIAMAFVAVMQFPIMHSQIARPYSPGLLFVLLTIYFTSDFKRENARWRSVLWLAAALALSAYTHHLAALVAALSYLAGYIIVSSSSRRYYALSGILAILFYLPHLPVTLDQLSMKGIGTVLPDADLWFFVHHFSYIFHFSWLFFGLFLLLVALSVANLKSIAGRSFYYMLILWSGTFVISYVYSLNVGAVVQDRVFLFVLPPMLFMACSGMQKINHVRLLPVLALVLLVGGGTLVFSRNHYTLFYNSGFDDVAAVAAEYSEDDLRIVSYHPPILDYQERVIQNRSLGNVMVPDSSWTMRDYIRQIQSSSAEAAFYGWTTQYYIPPPEVFPTLLRKYPGLWDYESFSHGEMFQLSKTGEVFEPYKNFELNIEEPSAEWNVDISLLSGTADSTIIKVGMQSEFFLKFEANTTDLSPHKNSRIYGSFLVKSDPGCEVRAVAELRSDEKIIHRRDVKFSEFQLGEDLYWVDIATALYFANGREEANTVAIYLWNKDGQNLEIHEARIWSEGLNRNIYGLDHKLVN
jgi:hypothetical protein